MNLSLLEQMNWVSGTGLMRQKPQFPSPEEESSSCAFQVDMSMLPSPALGRGNTLTFEQYVINLLSTIYSIVSHGQNTG